MDLEPAPLEKEEPEPLGKKSGAARNNYLPLSLYFTYKLRKKSKGDNGSDGKTLCTPDFKRLYLFPSFHLLEPLEQLEVQVCVGVVTVTSCNIKKMCQGSIFLLD